MMILEKDGKICQHTFLPAQVTSSALLAWLRRSIDECLIVWRQSAQTRLKAHQG